MPSSADSSTTSQEIGLPVYLLRAVLTVSLSSAALLWLATPALAGGVNPPSTETFVGIALLLLLAVAAGVYLTVRLAALTSWPVALVAVMALAYVLGAHNEASKRRSRERIRQWREEEDLKRTGSPPRAERVREFRGMPIS